MRSRFPRAIALAIALCSTPGLVAQRPGGGGAEMTVSVSVTPICTVAVRPGEWSADQAIDVQCRNLGASQPLPLVSHAASDHAGEVTPSDGVALIVINF